MKVKIAVIGSADFCHRTEQLTNDRQDIDIISYIYENPQEATRLVQSLLPCDVILFSGSLPFAYAKRAIKNMPIPALYLKQDERAIALTLLYLSTQHEYNLNEISIDVRDKSYINHIINDLKGKIELPHVYLLKDLEEIQDIVTYHEQLALNKKTHMAITSVHAVYEQLVQKRIPAFKMIDPESSLLHTIEQVKQKAILHKSESSQIAVGMVKDTLQNDNLEFFVTKIASLMQASWNEINGYYTLFTTMGNVDNVVENVEFHALFQELPSEITIGFGTGETLLDATANAQSALEFANNNPDHSFYLLDTNKKLHGPYPQSTEAVQMKLDEPALVEIATKTKLSPANISKLVQFSNSRNSNQFTANDLALYLDVTRRTAERMLKRLVEFNYVKRIGEEMAYKQGRPRALYEFNFATYR